MANSQRELTLACGVQHIDLTETGNGTAMAYRINLLRLAFAIVGRAVQFISGFSAQTVTGPPEIGRARLIGDVAEHLADFAFFNFPKGLAAELKIIALLIDRPTAVAINQDPVLHTRNQVLERNLFFGRLKGNI